MFADILFRIFAGTIPAILSDIFSGIVWWIESVILSGTRCSKLAIVFGSLKP